MSRRDRSPARFDRELRDLPDDMRWREWMGRVEVAIFASRSPVTRETLAGLVGSGCRLDDLLADIAEELRARPYEIVRVAGGWQFRTRTRYAEALRRITPAPNDRPLEFTKLEMIALAAIAYQQPITRAELSRLAGRTISRDVIGRLKGHGVIDAGPRAPTPGAPVAWVTTTRFLEVFSLDSLRDLPDLDGLEAAGLAEREEEPEIDRALDDALGLETDDGEPDNDDESADEARE